MGATTRRISGRKDSVNNLKPCPFCGSNRVIVIDHKYSVLSNSYGVECFNCKTQSYQFFDSRKKAIEAWNRREGEQT